jgi:RNA polymerase sigma-70 factor (ECF subfamily)
MATQLICYDTLPARMAATDPDLVLVQGIASGDEAALRELYACHGRRLYVYALRLTNDPALAEDVVQEALIAAWRTARGFRGEGRVIAWLLGIVHHLALKALRRPSTPISDEMEDSLPTREPSPEQHAQESEKTAWVRQGLQALSPEHRAVLELVFYQGLSLAEAAEVCGCPVGTIKSRLSYARQSLKGALSRDGVEDWR